MKLGTLKDGTRDGRLVVVSRDLAHAVAAGPIRTLQQALEDWAAAAPQLAQLDWLAGEWTGGAENAADGDQVSLNLHWAPNLNYMMGGLEHRHGGVATLTRNISPEIVRSPGTRALAIRIANGSSLSLRAASSRRDSMATATWLIPKPRKAPPLALLV